MNKLQIKYLRKLAHNLKPVVMLGTKGLSEAVINEINLALISHELIKIQMNTSDKTELQTLITTINEQTKSIHIYTIGKQVIFYKKSNQPKINFIS